MSKEAIEPQPAKRLSLRTNFRWTLVGNIVNAACLWGIITYLAKVRGEAVQGQLELGRTIAGPAVAATMLQLRALQVTDTKDTYTFAEYFGTRLLLAAAGFAAIASIGLFGYGGEAGLVVVLWGAARSIDSVSDIVRGLFQRYERMNLSAISMIVRGMTAFGAVALFLQITGSLAASLGAVVVGWVALLLIYELPRAAHVLREHVTSFEGQSLRPRFQMKTIKSLAWLGLPLGVVMFLGTLQESIPKGVLNAYHGEASLGIFGALIYPTVLGMMIVTALGQAASPRLASYYANSISSYRTLIRKLLLLALGLGVLFVAGAYAVGEPVLLFLYKKEYAAHHVEFVILSGAAAVTFLTSFCGYGLTAARVFHLQVWLRILSCGTAILVTIWLVPTHGVRGAAWTILVTAITMFLLHLAAIVWTMFRPVSSNGKTVALDA